MLGEYPIDLFIDIYDDIYVINEQLYSISMEYNITSNSFCTGLFIDILNNFYCSLANEHQVLMLQQNDSTSMPIVVAGTGCPGPIDNMLDYPHGIFVDEHFTLFVADMNNNRIQRFHRGQTNGVTVAGFGARVFFLLNKPTDVILDYDRNLFIVDSYNHRIVRLIFDQFECLIGCSGESGIANNQLHNPRSIAFDSSGSIFIIDLNNNRIQKFILTRNTCGIYRNFR